MGKRYQNAQRKRAAEQGAERAAVAAATVGVQCTNCGRGFTFIPFYPGQTLPYCLACMIAGGLLPKGVNDQIWYKP